MSPEEIALLRTRHYNAELLQIVDVHADRRIFRVRPDGGIPSFKPGQYVTLGLGLWEPRVTDVQEELSPKRGVSHLAKRAYSISCSLLDDAQQLVCVSDCPYLEFYIALVRNSDHAPVLTPRLFALQSGMRLFVGNKIVGHYSLSGIDPQDSVVFFATGTGEAPHNAMLAELLATGHRGRIVSVNSVRWRRDLAYLSAHRELERRYANYRYIPLTTREPENLDPTSPGYVGKQYVQDYVAAGAFERDSGCPLDPHTTHVFLCGNPAMIGYHSPHEPTESVSTPPGMIQVLAPRGFTPDGPNGPGTIRLEKFW